MRNYVNWLDLKGTGRYVFPTLPDAEVEAHNMLHVIDENTSEPDGYLYSEAMFAPIKLPTDGRGAL